MEKMTAAEYQAMKGTPIGRSVVKKDREHKTVPSMFNISTPKIPPSSCSNKDKNTEKTLSIAECMVLNHLQ